MEYGLFHWTATGIYKREDAVKVYKRESAAEKAATRLYVESNGTSDIVARPIHY